MRAAITLLYPSLILNWKARNKSGFFSTEGSDTEMVKIRKVEALTFDINIEKKE